MIKNLICPFCRNHHLKRTNKKVICHSCNRNFLIKEGVLFFLSPQERKKSSSDLEFTKKYVQAIKGKNDDTLKEKNNREFWERERGKSLAARLVDKKAFQTLLELANEDFHNFLVLDVGAGGGKEAEMFFDLGVRGVVCVDVSFDFLKLAKKRLKNQKAEFVIAAGENLPFKDKSFDLLVIYGSLHHFYSWEKGLKEAARVSKRVALVAEPSQMGVVGKMLEFLGWQTEYGEINTPRFSPNKIKDILQAEGMDVVYKTNFIWFPLSLFKRFVDNQKFLGYYFSFLQMLDNMVGFLGHNLTVFAKDR